MLNGRLAHLKAWAKRIQRDAIALWIAARDPRVPLPAKLVAGAIAAYALSPIDLIPDFVPVLGYLDEFLVLPLGILLAIRLIPEPLMAEFRSEADQRVEKPVSRAGLAIILALWLAAAALCSWAAWRAFGA